ncbi:unnamed protein product [Rotaria magnacalcarata]|nr:unnamed protein product [Rotaria magnacalcarata]
MSSKISSETDIPLFQPYNKEITMGEWESLGFQDTGVMWFQLFISILCRSKYAENNKQQFINRCRKHCQGNKRRQEILEDFEQNYNPSCAIKWYTDAGFIFQLLNKMLRLQNIEGALLFHFFIYDLYQQLANEFKKEGRSSIKTVYRGQRISNDELLELQNGRTAAFFVNQFFSTAKSMQIASIFAGWDDNQNHTIEDDLQLAMFEIKIKNVVENPFADIANLSSIADEEEVLFSVGTSFKIKNIRMCSSSSNSKNHRKKKNASRQKRTIPNRIHHNRSNRWLIQMETSNVDFRNDLCDDDCSDRERNCCIEEKSMNDADFLQVAYWMQRKGLESETIIKYYMLLRQYLPDVFSCGAYFCGRRLLEFEQKNYDLALNYHNNALNVYSQEQSQINLCHNRTDINNECRKRDHYYQCILFAIHNCIASIHFITDGCNELLKHYEKVISIGFGCFFASTLVDMLERFVQYARKCRNNGKYDLICSIDDIFHDAMDTDESFKLSLEHWFNRYRRCLDDETSFFVAILNIDEHLNDEELFQFTMIQNEKFIEYISSNNKNNKYDKELYLLYRRMGTVYKSIDRMNLALPWFEKAKGLALCEEKYNSLQNVKDRHLKSILFGENTAD